MLGQEKTTLRNMSLPELESYCMDLGEKSYRGRQIYSWLHQKNILDINEMTDISLKVRILLANKVSVCSLKINKVESAADGTKKYRFKTEDEYFIESVYIPEDNRHTVCVSSQVGCKLKCLFCRTGQMGFKRNLSTAEIIEQITHVQRDLPNNIKLSNVVFMGMGEPLDNYSNVSKAIKIFLDDKAANFSRRRITVSTAGVVPQMLKMGNELAIQLAVSLNAVSDKERSYLMPINKKYSLNELIDACRIYPLDKRSRITFEYVLIKNVNDSLQHAMNLAKILGRIKSKLNLISFNPFPTSKLEAPDYSSLELFKEYLIKKNVTVRTRMSRGSDILAACGQLSSLD